LWPEVDESRARSNLRHTLFRLRKALDDEYFSADKVSIRFNPGQNYHLDIDQLEIAGDETISSEDLADRVSAYKGELLSGFYDEWITLERERFQALFEYRMQDLLDQLTMEGKWREVRKWGEFWIGNGTSPEPAYRALMMAYAGLGDLSGVANIYQRCVDDLRSELSVEPSAETNYLYKRLSRGEWIPKKLDDHPVHDLPTPPTPFVGRDEELRDIKERISDPECRLLTLVGIGGIGKSRLALQVAFDLVDAYKNGVFFIPLASVESATLLVSTIIEAIGFQIAGEVPPKEQLMGFLREKETLLILDNFEHLLDAAALLSDIVNQSPKVKILTTSRERLNLRGEWLFEVMGLPDPIVDETKNLAQYDVVQLFTQSARRIDPDFLISEADQEHLIQICKLVGGMPLAIELAASWVRMLSLGEIEVELEKGIDFLSSSLRDMPERHKSIQVVFDTSWNLLTDQEKVVFKKLSVFRSGFGRRAAERVGDASLSDLSTFVDKLFLHKTSVDRYEIQGLLRQYAGAKLKEQPEEEQVAKFLHCDTYADMLSEIETKLRSSKRQSAIEEISLELDNIRTAWDWAVEVVEVQQFLKCVESLWLFYDIRGWFYEGHDAFGRAIDALRGRMEVSIDQDVEFVMAQLLNRRAWFAWRLGKYMQAKRSAEEGLSLVRALDIQAEIAFTLDLLGTINRSQGFYPEAKEYCEESLDIWREIGNRWGAAIALFNLGQISHALGEYGDVDQPYRQGLEILKDATYQYGATFSMDSLGGLVSALTNLKEAKDLCLESLAIRRELNDQWGVASCLDRLGAVLCGLFEYQDAEGVCQESLEIKRAIGDRRGMSTSLSNLAHVKYLLEDYPQARGYCEGALAIRRELGDRRGIASSLDMLGNITSKLKDYQQAKTFCQECLEIRRELGEKAGIATALNSFGKIFLVMGEYQAAAEHLHEALLITFEIGAVPLSLDIAVGVAQIAGEMEDTEGATRWLSFISHHSGGSPDTKERAKELFEKLSSHAVGDLIDRAWTEGSSLTQQAFEADITNRLST
jgi:predicted ATPase